MDILDKYTKYKNFYNYLYKHIKLVNKYAKKILKDKELPKEIDTKKFIEEIKNHDLSKLEEPELSPYLNFYEKDSIKENEILRKAALHHVLTNKHHPEFWDSQKEKLKDVKNFEEDLLINATEMPLTYIACMAADWMAKSNEKNSSPFEWAKNNINKRWKFNKEQFNKEQIDFLYKILNKVYENEK